MFLVELAAGELADSRSLQADAIDFFADAANYGITLGVAGLALSWRARATLFKGITLLALGAYVVLATLWAVVNGSAPDPSTIGVVGGMALTANLAVAAMLYRWRSGDANMQSVWICTRNDVIANFAVLTAALGVFGTGTRWPDLAVASIMALLSLSGGWRIIQLALAEMRPVSAIPQPTIPTS
jgi:Co/Zn/Cd efflux system component